jgi:1,4-dihydroxy-2-naphthoate octaprenyltransferase
MTSTATALPADRAVAIRFIKVLLFGASIVPSFVAGAVAYRLESFDAATFALLTLGILLGQAGGDYLYYYFTHRNADPRDTHTKIFAGWRPFFSDNLFAGRRVLIGGFGCLALALAIGVYFARIVGPAVYAFAAVGGVIALFFTPLMLRGYKEPIIFIAFGPAAMLGMVYVMTGRLEPMAFAASLPIAFLVTLVAHLKSAHFDLVEGGKGGTEVVVKLSRGLVTFLALGAFVALGVGVAIRWLPLASLLMLAVAPLAYNVVRTASRRENSLMDYLWAVVRSLVLMILGGGLLAAGILLT